MSIISYDFHTAPWQPETIHSKCSVLSQSHYHISVLFVSRWCGGGVYSPAAWVKDSQTSGVECSAGQSSRWVEIYARLAVRATWGFRARLIFWALQKIMNAPPPCSNVNSSHVWGLGQRGWRCVNVQKLIFLIMWRRSWPESC